MTGRPYRLIVTGSRDWADLGVFAREISQVARTAADGGFGGLIIVHGACYPSAERGTGRRPHRSADWLAHLWVVYGQHPAGLLVVEDPHPAKWSAACRPECRHGDRGRGAGGRDYCPSAGNYRNQLMVDGGADAGLAFPIGRSSGTRDCITRMRAAGIPVRVVDSAAPHPQHLGRTRMTRKWHVYSTSDPAVVGAYRAARAALDECVSRASRSARALGRNNGPVVNRHPLFGVEIAGLRTVDPTDPPAGWRHVKGPAHLLPCKGPEGDAARRWLTEHQPQDVLAVLADHGLPRKSATGQALNPEVFEHRWTLWARYRGDGDEGCTWTPRKLSEFRAARDEFEAAETAEADR